MKRVMLWRKLLMIGSTHLGHCLIDLEQKLICNFVWLGFLQCPSRAHVFSNPSHGLLDRGERTILKWSSRTTRTFILSIVDVYDENEVQYMLTYWTSCTSCIVMHHVHDFDILQWTYVTIKVIFPNPKVLTEGICQIESSKIEEVERPHWNGMARGWVRDGYSRV